MKSEPFVVERSQDRITAQGQGMAVTADPDAKVFTRVALKIGLRTSERWAERALVVEMDGIKVSVRAGEVRVTRKEIRL
jgi:hypothetical protein